MTARKKSALLWTVQALLAALFLFAGTMKFILPPEQMASPVPIPFLFIRFIGAAEIAGALGLVLPGLFRIRTELTPIAAIGLVMVMSGAVVVTIESGMIAPALLPLVVGLLLTGARAAVDCSG